MAAVPVKRQGCFESSCHFLTQGPPGLLKKLPPPLFLHGKQATGILALQALLGAKLVWQGYLQAWERQGRCLQSPCSLTS